MVGVLDLVVLTMDSVDTFNLVHINNQIKQYNKFLYLFYCLTLRMPKCNIDVNTRKTTKWVINPSILGGPNTKGKSIYKSLFDKYEWAGNFGMKYSVKKNCKYQECTLINEQDSTLEQFNQGNATSVKTSDGYCNFHTHPFSCYKGEQTVWGWPSGEDMREVIGFMLRNNLFHLVFALEGIYMIQTNPNFLSILEDDKRLGNLIKDNNRKYIPANIVRGIIISLIESYFKATHGHRNIQYNDENRQRFNPESKEKYTSEYWGICMPQDWVNFANNFKLSNMINKKKNTCSKMLPCNCFPEYETKIGTISLSQYLKMYSIDIYNLTKHGKITNVDNDEEKYYGIIEKNFDKIINLFDDEPTVSYGNEKWNKGQWFKVKIFYNEFKCNPDSLKYKNFLDWMEHCIKSEYHYGVPLTRLIHGFWENCQKNKDGFTFSPGNPVTAEFKPLKVPKGSTYCSIKHGPDIHNWISKIKHGNKKTGPTRKRNLKGKKNTKVSAFGLNPHKR